MTRTTAVASTDDLLYVPPPTCPRVELHPSRMGVAALLGTVLRAGRPRATRRRLERLVGREVGRSCALTDTGRAALRLAVSAEVARGATEVIVSTFNCPAVADAVLAAGATPVLVDFHPDEGPLLDQVDLDGRVVVLTNGLGMDEWRRHGRSIVARGGRVLLDLAQAVPAPRVLGRYADADCPIVLSFGAGKPLGGVGGGALLSPPGSRAESPAGPTGLPGGTDGWAAVRHAVAGWVRHHGPAPVRSAAVRRLRRSPGWSETKADHLPSRPGPVDPGALGRWAAAAATTLLANADPVAVSADRCHEEVRAAVSGRLVGCRFAGSTPDLTGGIELVFHERGDRLRFARQLAARGIPSTWNYYPLHRIPAYAPFARGPMAHADALWPRVLTVPKQPQHRFRAATLADALLDADRAVSGGGRDG